MKFTALLLFLSSILAALPFLPLEAYQTILDDRLLPPKTSSVFARG
jgi:hypothetical protein